VICTQDEERHPLGEGDLWNESYWFAFYDGKQQLGASVRIGLQGNLGIANIWCLLVRDGKKAYQRFQQNLPYTEASLAEGLSVGGLCFQLLEPLQRLRLTFADGDTSFNLIWDGIYPAEGSDNDLPENMAVGHYEQAGMVSGRFTVKGASYDFDGAGGRDHSWGIRDWAHLKGWNGIWPVFGPDLVVATGSLFFPDGSERARSLYFDGEKNIEVLHSELHYEIGDDCHTPTHVRAKLHLETAQEVEVVGKRIANFPLPYDGNILNESFFEFQLGNRIGYGLSESYVGL